VFVAMQAPFKAVRDKYLIDGDIQIIMENNGKNPKDEKGYNKTFNPNYRGVHLTQSLQEFNEQDFYDKFMPKVLVPARFQGFHKGHKVIFEEAKRLSPNVTVAMRVDDGDIIDLDKNIALLESKGYNVIQSPGIDEDWTSFADKFDIYVQGNPVVIEKFKDSKCKLHHVPRYGDVSGTGIRKDLAGSLHQIDEDVKDLIKESLDGNK
jgi:cytidyltransferase-like protein